MDSTNSSGLQNWQVIFYKNVYRLRIFIYPNCTSSTTVATTVTTEINNNSIDELSHPQAPSKPLFMCIREIDLRSAVTCLEYTFTHVYVGLENGQIVVFEIAGVELHTIEGPSDVLQMSTHPVKCLLVAGDKLWAASHNTLFVIQCCDLTEKVNCLRLF